MCSGSKERFAVALPQARLYAATAAAAAFYGAGAYSGTNAELNFTIH